MSLQQQQQPHPPRRLRLLFVDGSCRDRYDEGVLLGTPFLGAACCTWMNNEWIGVATSLGQGEGTRMELSRTAEVYAIHSALDFIGDLGHIADDFVILGDCRWAQHDIENPHFAAKFHRNVLLIEEIWEKIRHLAIFGITVTLAWIPSHRPPTPENYQGEGNRVADEMATRACVAAMQPGAAPGIWCEHFSLEPEGHVANFDPEDHQS